MRVHQPKIRQGRTDRRFRPCPGSDRPGWESGLELETRVLLSARAAATAAAHHARPTVTHVTRSTQAATARITPAAEITDQYSQFANDFAGIVQTYITSINEQSSSTTTVTATLTAPYASGSSSMQVNNASVFFPNGSTTPVTAQATQGSFPSGSFYLTGYSGANTLFVSPSLSTPTSLSVGAVLTATLSTSASSSAAGILPSYIVNRTTQMATDLVQYFNSLPLRLPYFNTPPHTPNNRGAIQKYVYDSVAGSGSSSTSTSGTSSAQGISAFPGQGATSLQQLLLSIPLPTSAGSDLQIYDAAVASAFQQSLTQTLNGVAEVYSGRLQVNATIPNNRYGVSETGTVPSYILAQP